MQSFFDRHHIIGRVISDIRPAAFDYMIRNLDELGEIFKDSINDLLWHFLLLGIAYSTVFNPDGRWIVRASRDRTVKVWNVETFE